MRPSRSILPFLILAGLAAVLHLRTRSARGVLDVPPVTVDLARELFPAAAALGPISPDRPIAVMDATGGVLGSLLDTCPVAARNPGYGGPLPCVIGLSPEGLVVGVRLRQNAESPTFVEYVVEEGLLNTWNGLTTAVASAKPVDAISGATATSLAISGSVQQTLAAQGAPAARPPALRRPWTHGLPWGVLALALLSFLGGSRWAPLRLLVRLASVIVLGLLAGSCLSLVIAQNWLAHGVPWGRFPFLATLATVALLIPVLTGRNFYCAYACPFGGAQDLTGFLWPWWQPRLPRLLAAPLHAVRGAGLITLYVLLVAGVAIDLTAVEPFAVFQWRSAPWPALALAGGALFVAMILPRSWCQHLCPTGYLLERCRGLQPRADAAPGILSFERGALIAALAAALLLAARPAATPQSGGPNDPAASSRASDELETPRPRPIPDAHWETW